MGINFKYLTELGLFMQLFLLGAILSVIVMYITEGVKKVLSAANKIANKTWIINLVNAAICLSFGLFWAATFAKDTINAPYAIWLVILLYLGSTGLYTKLENSDGFWGKTVKSLSAYMNSDDAVSAVLAAAKKETDQITDESKK